MVMGCTGFIFLLHVRLLFLSTPFLVHCILGGLFSILSYSGLISYTSEADEKSGDDVSYLVNFYFGRACNT